ncbi:uncharacterized protein TNCV_973081 [Trichonephila clavipes]|nr:uncharacterized protein TNCV_973081 [Trichonephila clavipes]
MSWYTVEHEPHSDYEVNASPCSNCGGRGNFAYMLVTSTLSRHSKFPHSFGHYPRLVRYPTEDYYCLNFHRLNMACERLSTDEIANVLQELSENESDGDELSYSYLDSNKFLRLSESDCEESEDSTNEKDNIPVNPDIYVTRDGTE